VWTQDDQTVAAGHSVEARQWATETDGLLDRMAGRFARVETRHRARTFVHGLLADLPRKSCWTVAEHAGETDPHGMQHFLARASWDTDGVGEDLRDDVIGALGEDDGVLVVDETGHLKKGVHGVGVRRRYTGTAGRIEDARVAVYLAYAGRGGHAMIDRELYLPKSWTTDPDRLTEAGVPEEVGFATEPTLAAGMITRALAAGVPARWVTGDTGAGSGLACSWRRVIPTAWRARAAATSPAATATLTPHPSTTRRSPTCSRGHTTRSANRTSSEPTAPTRGTAPASPRPPTPGLASTSPEPLPRNGTGSPPGMGPASTRVTSGPAT
jgi:SRSO17 transposase